MKNILYLTAVLLLSNIHCAIETEEESYSTSESWNTYTTIFEGGLPGSVTCRTDLVEVAPIKKLNHVLITSIKYETSRSDRFPEEQTLSRIQSIGERLQGVISKKTQSVFAGSFMHDRERQVYFYVKNPEGLDEKVEKYITDNFPEYKYSVTVEEDEQWKYYKEFLYPDEETSNLMADQSVIMNLLEAGDDLTKARRVDHWLYFSTESDMEACKRELERQNFVAQSSGKNEDAALPYELQIWRIDKVDAKSIFPVTTALRDMAEEFNGEYDGWETSVEKE